MFPLGLGVSRLGQFSNCIGEGGLCQRLQLVLGEIFNIGGEYYHWEFRNFAGLGYGTCKPMESLANNGNGWNPSLIEGNRVVETPRSA